ncbi:DarT ssDNA thymidine ADP-ribosyltransferase family protein [Actinophytocola sp.]|uniref:DarT ssDNA thymidine ADP-ribosyltransferase family protein n=1 Tax=Actinophytocola sp. TaxID=1872138 RepID=UPI00389A33CA
MTERIWRNTDEDGDRLRRRQAEFLVHKGFPLQYISAIIARENPIAEKVRLATGNLIPVYVKSEWYY